MGADHFKKITGIRKIYPNEDIETYKPDRKSIEIIRMSCLRTASEILHGIDVDSFDKSKRAVDIAKEFEKYVTGFEEDNNAGGEAKKS